MSNELRIDYGTTGKTVYGIVVNNAGQVWNTATAAFEAILAANWTHYAIACGEQSTTGIYIGNLPTALSNGYYDIFFRVQAGGSPATTDGALGKGLVHWTGAADCSLAGVTQPTTMPPLCVFRDTFSAFTNGIFDDMDGRIPEIGAGPWQQGGDLFVVNGRCTALYGTANSFAGSDSYVPDNWTLRVIVNPASSTTGDFGVAFRGQYPNITSGNCWMVLLDVQAGYLRIGSYTANGGFVAVDSAPLNCEQSTVFHPDVDHVLTIRHNGTMMTAVLDGPVADQGWGICAVKAVNSTYLGNTCVGMVSNVIYGFTAGAGKNFSDIVVYWPTPAVLMGHITNVTATSPAQITSAGHGLVSGQVVNVYGVQEGQNNAVDGERWTVTRIDANTFSIPVNNTLGSYVSGGFWIQVLTAPPFPSIVSWAQSPPSADPIGAVTWSQLITNPAFTTGIGQYLLSKLTNPITITSNLVGSTLTLMKDTDLLAIDSLSIDLPGPAGVDISGGTFALNFDEGKLVITGSYVNVGGVQKGRFEPTAAQTKQLKAGILHNWAATVTLSSPTRTVPLVPGYGVAQVVSRQDGT